MHDETADVMVFTWGVPARGYVWKPSARAVSRLGGTGAAPFLLVHPKTSTTDTETRYSPLDEGMGERTRLLYREFANLTPFKDSIRAFANQRGWLGIGEAIVTPSEPRVQQGESLARWQYEILHMKHAVALWRDIQELNVERLQERIRLHVVPGKTGHREPYIEWTEWIPWECRECLSWPWDEPSRGRRSARLSVRDRFLARAHTLLQECADTTATRRPDILVGRVLYCTQQPRLFEELRHWNVLLAGKALLAELVNDKLRGAVSACLLLDRKRNLKGYSRPRHLLAAMWVQLSEAIQGQRRIIACRYCAQPIDVTEYRRSKTAHTRCVDNAKMARYRRKRA